VILAQVRQSRALGQNFEKSFSCPVGLDLSILTAIGVEIERSGVKNVKSGQNRRQKFQNTM